MDLLYAVSMPAGRKTPLFAAAAALGRIHIRASLRRRRSAIRRRRGLRRRRSARDGRHAAALAAPPRPQFPQTPRRRLGDLLDPLKSQSPDRLPSLFPHPLGLPRRLHHLGFGVSRPSRQNLPPLQVREEHLILIPPSDCCPARLIFVQPHRAELTVRPAEGDGRAAAAFRMIAEDDGILPDGETSERDALGGGGWGLSFLFLLPGDGHASHIDHAVGEAEGVGRGGQDGGGALGFVRGERRGAEEGRRRLVRFTGRHYAVLSVAVRPFVGVGRDRGRR
mmetsp:Transcript_29843/g.88608  ORF Transcript_29843/g.88608 Transcript_29843/m.88608 type:complete len:279 (-) Transcript_29843:672-1508(-)